MADQHLNYIGGEWVAGASTTRDVNPSDLSDVVGEYAQADAKQADGRFEHSPPESRSGLGENLAGGEVKDTTIRLATGRDVSPPVDERTVYQSNPIAIDGLWGLVFGNGVLSQPTNALFFTAGPKDESQGLFGRINAVN